jgi:hypothetical protein
MREQYAQARCLSLLIIFALLAGMWPPVPLAAFRSSPPALAPTLKEESSQAAAPSLVSTQASPFRLYLPLIVAPPAIVEAVIQPGIGGAVTSRDGRVQASFSPLSVSQAVGVRYQPIRRPQITTPALGTSGPAFALTAWEAATSTPVTQFPPMVTIISASDQRPATSIVTPSITIAVQYADADVWGLDLGTLALYTRERPDQPWQRLPTVVDRDRKLLIAEVDHLSEFVPMGRLVVDGPSAGVQRLVLDPDDDVGHATWPGVGEVREITYNMRLAQEVQQTNSTASPARPTR